MSAIPRHTNRPALVDFTLTQEIRSLTMEQGLDLFGVAPVARFAEVSVGFRPEDYLPGARTVVSIACAIANEFCDNWGTFEDEGKFPSVLIVRKRQPGNSFINDCTLGNSHI